MKYQYIFGPVSSRRLGRSLGIDLVPQKTCTLDCVYCESGKTTNLTLDRREYVPTDTVISELDHYLSQDPHLDYITFSGSGEPTLHTGINKIVRFIKNRYSKYKICLLTNGTLLNKKETREELEGIDLVIVSIDAASKLIFNKINRPHPALSLKDFFQGIREFKDEFSGSLWVEIFLVPGCNDQLQEVEELKTVLQGIDPEKIEFNTLDRPGTEEWVKKADDASVHDIAKRFLNVNVIGKTQGKKVDSLKRIHDEALMDKIVKTISRRPSTVDDIYYSLGRQKEQIEKCLSVLIGNGTIEQKRLPRGVFYRIPEKI